MAVEDSNEKRRRELEEILELRRSFGTLGRRLVNRQSPVRTGLGPTLVPLSPQPDEERPDAGERQHEDPELALDQDQDPDQQPGSRQGPAADEGPDQDHHERPEAPDAELAREPHDQEPPDQEPEPVQEERGEQPEAHRDREPAPVSTTVQRMTPIVDESYHGQAAAAQTTSRPLQIPDPPATRRRPSWPLVAGLVAVIAVVFALGMAAGRAVLEPSPRSAPPASLQAAPVASTPLSSVGPVRPQVSVPESCLDTARRADVLIDLLVKRARGIEVTRALKDYTIASQTCREEASTR